MSQQGQLRTGSNNALKEELSQLKATLAEIFRTKNIALIIATWILFGMIGPLFWSFSSDYMRQLGASPKVIGLLNSTMALVSMLVMIPGGYMADKRGRKGLIAWGTLLAAFPYFARAIAGSWQPYFLATAIGTAFERVYEPALHALFQDSIPERARAFTFSIVDALCWSVPGMVSSVIGGYLYQKFGVIALRWALIATGAVYLMSAALRFGLEETLKNQKDLISEPLNLRSTLSGVSDSFKGILEELSWLKGPLGRMMALDILSGVDWGLTGGFWLLFALDVIGVTRFEWGLLEASWNVIYVLLVPITGILSDRKGRIKVMRFSPGLFAILYLLLVMSRGFMMAFVVWVIWAIPDALWFASFEALWTDVVESNKRARISTLRSVLRTIAQMVSAAAAGFLYEINPAIPFCVAAFVWLIAFLNLQVLAKEHAVEV